MGNRKQSGADAPDKGKTLYLIDAMSLAYRAHYIFISRPLINSKGQNTSAAYGFTNSLLKLIEDHSIEHAAVVFDEGEEDTFRKEIYDDYKANRDPPPEDLLENLPYIKKIVEAMDMPVLEVPNVEADDVIGTLARQAEEDGAEVVIVSPDKDFKQLLSEQISIYKPAKGDQDFEIFTGEGFREEYELEPTQFIDMLALMGDSSDNIPGVYGIGEKTAQKLLREHHSVENLIEHADDLKGKRAREGMQGHADDARLSKTLVTIRTDCELEVDWHQLKRRDPHAEELVRLFDELEFKSLIEPFWTYFSVALWAGLFVTSPFIFYQVWKFVAPGLYRTERRYGIAFAGSSAVLFLCGAAFCYSIIQPIVFDFLLDYASANISDMKTPFGTLASDVDVSLRPQLFMKEFLDISRKLILAFGLVFELPLLIFFLSVIGAVTHRGLIKFSRWMIVLSAIVSAALTPPDVFSQLLLAGPILVMYFFGIGIAFVITKSRERRHG